MSGEAPEAVALHLTNRPEIFLRSLAILPEITRHIVVETMEKNDEMFALPWNSAPRKVFWEEIERHNAVLSEDPEVKVQSREYQVKIVKRLSDIDPEERFTHVFDLSGRWHLCPGISRKAWFARNMKGFIEETAVLYTTFPCYLNNWLTVCSGLREVDRKGDVNRGVISSSAT